MRKKLLITAISLTIAFICFAISYTSFASNSTTNSGNKKINAKIASKARHTGFFQRSIAKRKTELELHPEYEPDGKRVRLATPTISENKDKYNKLISSDNINSGTDSFKAIKSTKEYAVANKLVNDDGKWLFKGTMTYEDCIDTLDDMSLSGSMSYEIPANRMVHLIILSYNKTYTNSDYMRFNKPVIIWINDAETGKFMTEVIRSQEGLAPVDLSKIKDND